MHYRHVADITHTYDLVCLSPHLDDAALSCAGTLIMARQAGMRTLVVTVCTAVPPESQTYSALAVEFHAEWGLDHSEAVTVRHGEDRNAMAIMGVDSVWLDFDDAIYRMPNDYYSRETLFADPHPADRLRAQLTPVLRDIAARVQAPRWLVPAGVGMHVDHLNVLAAAEDVLPKDALALYEEVPYALTPEYLATRRALIQPVLHTTAMGPALAAKIAAVQSYDSQMAALFGDPATVGQQLTDYHRAIGAGAPAERWYTRP